MESELDKNTATQQNMLAKMSRAVECFVFYSSGG